MMREKELKVNWVAISVTNEARFDFEGSLIDSKLECLERARICDCHMMYALSVGSPDDLISVAALLMTQLDASAMASGETVQ